MGYDVFSSYSHAGDDLLSQRVQKGLQRFAKPWWRLRALNVFRDRTALSANPGLWSSITEAMDSSRFFLMLASPESAQSEWCQREVEHWRAQHGVEGMLLLLTGGNLVWDATRNDFDWTQTTALPRSFAGCFAEEPRHVDMRWARSETQLDLNNGRFRDQIGEIAAPVHGVPKDQIATLDVREHRRTIRQAIAAGIALVMLTLASIALTAFAISSRANAVAAEHKAQHYAREAAQNAQQATRNAKRATTNAVLAQANATRAGANATQARTNASHARTNARRASANAAKARQNAAHAQYETQVAQTNAATAQQNAAEATQQQHNAEQSANNALLQAYIAQLQRNAGTAHSLIAGSEAALSRGSTDTALLLAAQAVTFAHASNGVIGDNAIKPTLVNALQDNPHLVGWLRGIDGPVQAVTTSRDRSRAAALSNSGQVVVWRLADRQRLGAFHTSVLANPDGQVLDMQFLDTNTLVVAGDRLEAYRTVDGGATWTHAWTWPPRRSTSIDRFAASPYGIVVADSDRIELLDVFGHKRRSVVAPGLEYAGEIAFSPSGTDFAEAGEGPSLMNGTVPFVVDVFATKSGALVSSIPFTPQVRTNGELLVAGLGFSSDGRQITALVTPYTIPIYRFWVQTGKQVPVSAPGNAGQWGPIVPDTPIGLSPNLNDIIQTDPTDPNTIGIGYLQSDNFIDVHSAASSEFALNVDATPAVTSDSRLLLMPDGDSAVPVFDLSQQPRSPFARIRSVNLPPFVRTGTAALSPNARVLASVNGGCCGGPILTLTALDGAHRPLHIPLPPSPFKNSSGTPGLAFNERGNQLAIANENGSITVIDPATGSTLRRFHSALHHLINSPSILFFGTLDNGRLIEVSSQGHELWSAGLRWGTLVDTQVHAFGTALVLNMSADATGTRLVVLTSNKVYVPTAHIFNASGTGWTETTSYVLPANDSSPTAALSPGGAELVVGDLNAGLAGYRTDDGALLWRDTSAGSLGEWFGSDGSLLTESASTGDISVRSPSDGSVQYTLGSLFGALANENEVVNVPLYSFAFLNGHILTAAVDNEVYANQAVFADYPLATADLVHAACAEAGRNLTHAEWAQYVGPEPYELTCPSLPPPEQ